MRFGVFSHNYKKIVKFNEEHDGLKLGLNKFSDLTSNEFKSQHASCAFYEPNLQQDYQVFDEKIAPLSVDWRSKGAVTPVKNQLSCGSCWAFSTTGALEGFYFVNRQTLLSFSEQQIIDCDVGPDQGCDGGYPYLALEYTAKNGLEVEADYPYVAKVGTCQYAQNISVTVNSGYSLVTPNSTAQLKQAVATMPVSVLIEADQDIFQHYKSGVIKAKDNCGANLDHAVLVVGYHLVDLVDTFIVKNSWGADWGDNGYVEISGAKANDGVGVCGILAQPVIVA